MELYNSVQLNYEDLERIKSLTGPILIIGASGFIGSNLFHCLASRRTDVYAASPHIKKSWRLEQFKNLRADQLITLDLTNKLELESQLKSLKPQTIFNLAAYGSSSQQTDSEQIHQVNYVGTLNLLEVLASNGFGAFVQAGTSSEYGTNASAPSENSFLQPNSHYSVSKGASQLLIQYYGKNLQLPVCHLRLYSIYGPWEDPNRLLPSLINAASKNKFPPMASPDTSRDFVYIDDCIRALLVAAHLGCNQYRGETFNIASGVMTNLNQLCKLTKELFNINEEPKFASFPNRQWDLNYWVGNPSKAKKLLQWQTQTSLAEGLKKTFAWQQSLNAQASLLPPQKIKLPAAPTLPHIDVLQPTDVLLKPKVRQPTKVSCIVACYRDAEAIPNMYQRLAQTLFELKTDFEIIFVNDASPSNDWQIITQLSKQDSRVFGISHSRNFGSQSAFFSGMELATGDALVLLDGDLQDPPELIKEFYQLWQQGYQVIYGIRKQRVAPWYMQMFYKLFYRIFAATAEIKIPKDAGDFSLIDRKVAAQLLKFSERDFFLRGLRAWVGFKQIGVPYSRPERLFGQSTNNFFKNIWWAKKAIFSFSAKPLYYIQAIGLALFLLSFVLDGFYFLILIIGGLNMLAVSIIGDYMAKILEEVKNRPRFIRNQIVKDGQVKDCDLN